MDSDVKLFGMFFGLIAFMIVGGLGGYWYEQSSINEARMACIQSDKQWVENSCVFGTR